MVPPCGRTLISNDQAGQGAIRGLCCAAALGYGYDSFS
jgi:hypothetical protein